MKGDPYRENFIAEASMVGLMMPELVRLIHAGWAPLSDDATAALVIGKKLISASSENPAACVERSIVEPMPLSLVRPAVVSSWDA